MEITKRAIMKIAREVSRFTAREVRSEGVGASEYDMIHAVRKQPGTRRRPGWRQIWRRRGI